MENLDDERSDDALTGRWVLRIAALVIAVVPLGLMSVTRQLQPNSNGLGTHQQLGLPPCSMRALFGIRCPSCGMTTSWAHFTRGQWWQSMRMNFGGFLLACFSVWIAWLAMRVVWMARLPSLTTQRRVTFASVTIVLVTLVDWLFRLAAG